MAEEKQPQIEEQSSAWNVLKWTFMGVAGCLVAHTVIDIAGLWGVSKVAAGGIVTAFNSAVKGESPDFSNTLELI